MNRRQDLLKLLNTQKYMSFVDLAKALHYSESTIRRDCLILEKEGLISKRKGGVLSLDKQDIEAPTLYKKGVNPKEKTYIASLASEYLQPEQTIFLDGSSSVNAMSPFLKSFDNLRVYTTNIDTAVYISHNTNNDVNIIGGHLKDVIVNGPEAIWNIAQMNYDVAFISCRGIDLEHGVTDRLLEESGIKRIIGAHTKRLILLVDSSKFNKTFTYLDLQLNALNALVTDTKPSQEYIDFCKKNQIELVY